MPAGRPPKPLDLHILEGTFERSRHGKSCPVVADGEPMPPRWLKGEALKFWKETVPELIASNVVKALDAPALAQLCAWWAQYRRLSAVVDRMKVTDKRLPQYLSAVATASAQFSKLARLFGLNPCDRSRLRIPPPAAPRPGVWGRDRTGGLPTRDRSRDSGPAPLEPSEDKK